MDKATEKATDKATEKTEDKAEDKATDKTEAKDNEQKTEHQAYLDSLNEKELKAYNIAKTHLGMSFQLEKSIGFIGWKELK